MSVPNFEELFNPLLIALHKMGGSATINELEVEVAQQLKLSVRDQNELHRPRETKLSYRLAWARTYLKWYGLIQNSERGVWSLTAKGLKTKKVDKRTVARLSKPAKEIKESSIDSSLWRMQLIEKILALSPKGFEYLCQRLLREYGFDEVEVIGRAGDGGIDGTGIIKINEFLSFPIVFQCKRYSGSVSSKMIRDFRGAMSGRTDKGLFITTGRFTTDARLEASRQGATHIDLVEGEELADALMRLDLGVKKTTVEQVEVDYSWFSEFDK